MADDHLEAVERVYGPETWAIYDLLDRSLDPRPPEVMLALATERLSPESVVLDVGCRDARHLIELVRATGAMGVGIDPLPRFVERARKAVVQANLDDRIEIFEGVIQALPFANGSFDVVWCRDVLEIVQPLDAAVVEAARVLRQTGDLIVFTVVATNRLHSEDAALLAQSLAVVPANLVEATLVAAFERAGLAVAVSNVIGTEWREHAEERTQPVSRDLLRLARLRRQRERIVEEAGEDIYEHIESNLHWSVYQFLGKLVPVIYVLQKARRPTPS